MSGHATPISLSATQSSCKLKGRNTNATNGPLLGATKAWRMHFAMQWFHSPRSLGPGTSTFFSVKPRQKDKKIMLLDITKLRNNSAEIWNLVRSLRICIWASMLLVQQSKTCMPWSFWQEMVSAMDWVQMYFPSRQRVDTGAFQYFSNDERLKCLTVPLQWPLRPDKLYVSTQTWPVVHNGTHKKILWRKFGSEQH